MKSKIIGVTGIPGSGKTRVAKILESWGRIVFFSDDIAKCELYGNKAHQKELKEILGVDPFIEEDGNIDVDRALVRSIIAKDEGRRRALSALAAELVWKEIEPLANDYDGFIYVESATLNEVGWNDSRFFRVMCVSCEEDIALERIMKREIPGNRPFTREEALALMNMQFGNREKIIRSGGIHLYNGAKANQEDLEERLRIVVSLWDPTIFETRKKEGDTA